MFKLQLSVHTFFKDQYLSLTNQDFYLNKLLIY